LPRNALAFSLQPLDTRFVGPKPVENTPLPVIEKLEESGDLITERKRNGYGSYVCLTGVRKPRVAFYTRGVDDITAKFPSLRDEMRSVNGPSNSLFVAEMFTEVGGSDSPGAYTSIVKSKADQAIALQRDQQVKLALFNVLVHKGKSVTHLPYADRLDIVRNTLAKHAGPAIQVVEVLDVPFSDARARSLSQKWEGLVLYDRRASTEYHVGTNARTPRPEGCWKWKPYIEGDFVATGFVPSTASSHAGAVKDFLIAQYNPLTGELEEWGRCGIGISEAKRREYADAALYPMVFEIRFERRTKNRRLILAKILRRRFDKKPEECLSPPNWEQDL
jgi:ATP-dependent DNA ligase